MDESAKRQLAEDLVRLMEPELRRTVREVVNEVLSDAISQIGSDLSLFAKVREGKKTI